ncbi:MAG: protoporphyrinogen oxidase [Verrucomicrobiota bacterium]|nr:protoporphyrinogen oxidase [Verrucomicrobiota bacterium]
MEKTALIIGAGLSGLSLAHGLSKAGWKVRVLESSDQVGGVIRSTKENGYLVEAACSSMMIKNAGVDALIHEIGLDGELCPSNPAANNRYIVRAGKLLAVPMSPLAFLRSSLWTIGGKLRLMREPFIAKRRETSEESIESFVRRRVGDEFYNYAINPMVAGIYAGDPAKLAIKHAFTKVWALEEKYGSLIKGTIGVIREGRRTGTKRYKSKLVSFKDGMQALPNRLAELLGGAVVTSARIEQIQLNGSRVWQVSYYDPNNSQGRTECYSRLIITVPAHRLGSLPLPQPLATQLQPLAEIPYAPAATVALGFKRSAVAHALDGFGMLIPSHEGHRILGTLFQSTLFPGRAPEGHVLLTSFVGGALQPELVHNLDNTQRVSVVMEELRKLLGVREDPVYQSTTVWPRGIPQYNLGHDRFLNVMNAAETDWPLHLCANFRGGVGAGDCITNGLDLARRINEPEFDKSTR